MRIIHKLICYVYNPFLLIHVSYTSYRVALCHKLLGEGDYFGESDESLVSKTEFKTASN